MLIVSIIPVFYNPLDVSLAEAVLRFTNVYISVLLGNTAVQGGKSGTGRSRVFNGP